MAANANDLLIQVGDPGTATTLSAPGYTAGGTSITVGSTSNWPTATGVIFAIDEAEVVDGEEVRIDGTYNEFEGVVSTGTSITSVDWVRGVGDRNYAAGALTRVYIPVSAERENRIVQWGTAEHSQTGSHTNITATSITATTGTFTSISVAGTGTGGGWDGVPTGTITAVTANGNRNYDLTTSADNTALISPGMRLRTTRTVAAPTQCATFDGSNDYFSKSSPAGMTFTDDFVVGAWIKVSSYANGDIVTRHNNTSGWRLFMNASGQIGIFASNAGLANYSQVQTYQSIPLNKWIHVTAQLDMSAFTATTTTSYVMFDGVDVPAAVTRAGTNPTALIQAGNLEIGSFNAGNFITGKIAQAFVSSAKITQANVRTLYSQGLTSALITANNIISAYSFSNAITDLNTTNANNLTANGGVLATTADSPFGGQAGGTISSTLDYGIVAKVTASTITVNVAEGCTIPTSGGVSTVSYSTYKSPYGFPSQADKWDVIFLLQSIVTASGGVLGTQYNPGGINISVPIGAWDLRAMLQVAHTSTGAICDVYFGMSTSTSTLTDQELVMRDYIAPLSGAGTRVTKQAFNKKISTSAVTPYYLLISSQVTSSSLAFRGVYSTNAPENTYVVAGNSYL